MKLNLITYGGTALIFFALDFIWLSLALKPVYKAHLGSLLMDKPNLPVAGAFYLAYVVGIVVFAIMPAEDWMGALWRGALLGLMAYGTYDMTNLATLSGWSKTVTFIDMAWGTVATGAAATAGYFILSYFAH